MASGPSPRCRGAYPLGRAKGYHLVRTSKGSAQDSLGCGHHEPGWGGFVRTADSVNTRSKVHQHTEVKIHQLEERRVDGFVSGRGSARGIAPLAAAKI